MTKFSARKVYSKIFGTRPCLICGKDTSNYFPIRQRKMYICSKECFEELVRRQISAPSDKVLRIMNETAKKYDYGEVILENEEGEVVLKVR